MLIRLGICTFRIMSVSHVCVIASKPGVLQLFVCVILGLLPFKNADGGTRTY